MLHHTLWLSEPTLNEVRPILSLAHNSSGTLVSLWQYKVSVDICRGSLENGCQTTVLWSKMVIFVAFNHSSKPSAIRPKLLHNLSLTSK